jgi:ParB family chromosome partitioning protein
MLGFTREKSTNKIIQAPIIYIRPNPNQPRTEFDPVELQNLADSIRQNGLLQPLTVRKRDDGTYELVAGERRLRACKLLRMETVPCIIVDMNDRSAAVMALVENIQRTNLGFFDEANAISKLINIYGLTQEDAALRLGKAQSTVANKIRLLKLTEDERTIISENHLTERHARALLKITDPDDRMTVLNQVIKLDLNVERTETAVDAFLSKQAEKVKDGKRSCLFKDVRLFVNTINKAVETMKSAGIPANSSKIKHDDCIEYRVFIPIES